MPDLSDEKKILAELLGTADAVFIPMRGKFRQRPVQVRQERRAAWRSAGLPLRSHGADAGGRKDFENAARQLESAGLLIVERGQAGRRSVAKFSELGESVARTLAATGDVAMEWELFTNFAEMSKAVDGRPIAEHVVVGIRRWKGRPSRIGPRACLSGDCCPTSRPV